MSKDIICVYQDCILCGDRGKKLRNYIITHGLNVRKVSFASEEGRKLVAEAVFEHKIGTMPFYTDGVKFSTTIIDFVEKPQKKEVKRKKTKKISKKIKEGESNESN